MKIVYVHGANASPLSFTYIASELNLEYEFFTYSTNDPVMDNVKKLKESLTEETILICHSLGGVIGVLAGNDNLNVKKIITMCSPFGGSNAADVFKWFSGHQLFKDISKNSLPMNEIQKITNTDKILNICSVHSRPLFSFKEKTDGVVTLTSQQSLKCKNEKVMEGNHFEVLLNPETVKLIKEFIL
jgi:esterase/lipase